jgi:hypothetical protein
MRRVRGRGEVGTAVWWESMREKVATSKDLVVNGMILNES